MYKVYLSPSTQDKTFGVGNFGSEAYRMNQIADEVEKQLFELREYVVYRNNVKMTKEDIIEDSNKQNADIHVAIHSNYGKEQGINCYTKENCLRSNGVAKEIYKQLIGIYYDKNIDRGIIYDNKIVEVTNIKNAAVLVEVGFHGNIEDSNWIIKNIKDIGKAIANGIDKGIRLKLC